MASALLRDETMTGREIASWTLPGLPDRVTARELLRLRVREEVARYNARHDAVAGGLFRGLVRPRAAVETPDGFRLPPATRVDWEVQADAACAAFTGNAFVMLAGDRQVDSLDELIDLPACDSIVFIRLIPLVGG